MAHASKAPLTLADYKAQLVSLPAGTFRMGSRAQQEELPVHSVTLSAFQLGRTPVTVAMYKEFCAATSRKMPEDPWWGWIDDHPMVNVSWEAAKAYADWAGLALPTEAQWEYAAHGGTTTQFPWGDAFDRRKVWSVAGTNRSQTAPVVREKNLYKNGYGLTDMGGNVWQWCADWFGRYSSNERRDPTGPASGDKRALRGASWYYFSANPFRCTARIQNTPGTRHFDYGFRLASRG